MVDALSLSVYATVDGLEIHVTFLNARKIVHFMDYALVLINVNALRIGPVNTVKHQFVK